MSSRLIIIGTVLLVIGAALPFAMLIGILESTFFLNFVAAISSIFGIVIGFIGIIEFSQARDKDKF